MARETLADTENEPAPADDLQIREVGLPELVRLPWAGLRVSTPVQK